MAKFVVYLDAGHAKSTAGKKSPDSSFYEWEFNNDMQYRMKKRLEAHGIEVVLTNPNPATVKDIALSTRCSIANKHWTKAGKPSALFVSIHADAYGNGEWNTANGIGTFVSKSCSSNSEKAAKYILTELVSALKLKDRGVRKENYTVIAKTNMPGALIEHAFYTNKNECEILKSSSKRDLMAEANVKAICKYFNITYKSSTSSNNNNTNTSESSTFKVGDLNKPVIITTDSLNVRSGRGTEHKVIGSLKKGSKIEIWSIAKASDGRLWGSFRYDPKNVGFVCMDYVKLA